MAAFPSSVSIALHTDTAPPPHPIPITALPNVIFGRGPQIVRQPFNSIPFKVVG